MKRSIKKLAVLLMLVSVFVTCFVITASAATATYNGYTFTYTTNKTTATLDKTTSSSQTWKLPSTVTRTSGKTVYDYSVTAINSSFFYNSTYAKYVTYLRLPSTLENIQNGLFQSGVNQLKTIEIFGANTTCSDYFLGCTALTEFVVNESNTNLKAVDGILYDYNGSTLMKFPAAKALEDTTVFEVPDDVETIKPYSFYKAKKVTEIRIPATVTTIGTAAFCDSTITAVHFEDGTAYDVSTYKCNCGKCAENLAWCIEDVEELTATCQEPGHTAGIRCDITKEWFSGEETPQLEHRYTIAKMVEATCTKNAVKVDTCEYCLTATKETEYPNTAKGHTGGKATCSALAVCERCTEPYGELDSNVHSFTNYIFNNNAACEKDGTKTAACDYGCGKTETVTAKGTATGHSFTEFVKSSDAACGKNATETAPCENGCGVSETRQIEGTALSHIEDSTPVIRNNVPATCEKEGSYTEVIVCSVCGGDIKSNVTTLPALGHSDNNGDNVCDNGGETLRNPADDCTHICHKSGIMGFIWKVIRFFQKLFKMNPVCECGVAHY